METIIESFKNVFGFAFNQPIYKTLQQMCVMQVIAFFMYMSIFIYIVIAIVAELKNNAVGQTQYDIVAVLVTIVLALIPLTRDTLKSITDSMEKNNESFKSSLK